MAHFVICGALTPANIALRTALRSLGVVGRLYPPDEAEHTASPGDVLLGRIDVRSGFDGIEPGLEQLLRLEGGGLTVLNRAGPLYACHDKLATAVALHSAGIRHPETAVLASPTNRPIFEGPFMVKPRFGSCWGHDAFLCPTDRR